MFVFWHLNKKRQRKHFMSKPSSLKPLSFAEDTDHHPAAEWLIANKKIITIAFAALFALILLAYRLLSNQAVKAENDFFSAQSEFNAFQRIVSQPYFTAEAVDQALSKLQGPLERHPELHAKYDGSIAQTLLIANQPAQAAPYAEGVFKRTSQDPVSFYRSYGETSLAIEEGRYGDAYQQALSLKDLLSQTPTGHETLYLFNLVRLAFLQQQLHLQQEELQTWNELQNTDRPTSLMAVYKLFSQGQASLAHYIDERKKILSH